MKKIPAVSVIIPMYNAEKYIGECLESILTQTFQDFEVIVVDDCSTDSSVEVVESYASKFGGQLKIIRTLKNSGSPGIPGNMGLRFSCGEYLSILDNDDAITPDALEKLYSTARAFDADVVACEKYYEIPTQFFNDAEYVPRIIGVGHQTTEPTLLGDDLSKRLRELLERKFVWNLWSKLIRRDFVIKNDLYFTDNLIQDMIFTCCLVIAAKRFVRVPYIVNRYRFIDDSLSHKFETPDHYLRKYLRALRTGFDYLEKFFDARTTFQPQPEIKGVVLNLLLSECLTYIMSVYGKVSNIAVEEIFRLELTSENFSPALTAAILNRVNVFRFNLWQAEKRIAALENEIRQLKSKE